MAYIAFKDFYSNKTTSEVSIKDFLVCKFGITLPEGVQTFFDLKAANVLKKNKSKGEWCV